MNLTNSCQTTDLFANPSNTVRYTFHTFDNSYKKAIRYLHEHRETGGDDGLNIQILGCDFWRNPTREVRRKGSSLFLDLVDHLFIHLQWSYPCESSATRSAQIELTLTGLISRLRSLCSIKLLIRSARTLLR